MNLFRITDRNTSSHGWADMAVMTLLTAFSVYNGEATIFYIVYLFWWREFLSVLIDSFFDRRYKRESASADGASKNPSFLLLVIYWLFIVIIFGLIANWNHQEAMLMNFGVLFFKNLFFNLNLIFMASQLIFLNVKYGEEVKAQASAGITGNMIVLHISIILGAFILFLVVKKFPEVFTPGNTWGSVLIIAPFLLLRALVQVLERKQ